MTNISSYLYIRNDKITQKMIIKKELLEKWKALRSPEDTGRLAEQAASYPELFARAFREGKCSDDVFKAMADFYEQKAKLIKQYL